MESTRLADAQLLKDGLGDVAPQFAENDASDEASHDGTKDSALKRSGEQPERTLEEPEVSVHNLKNIIFRIWLEQVIYGEGWPDDGADDEPEAEVLADHDGVPTGIIFQQYREKASRIRME